MGDSATPCRSGDGHLLGNRAPTTYALPWAIVGRMVQRDLISVYSARTHVFLGYVFELIIAPKFAFADDTASYIFSQVLPKKKSLIYIFCYGYSSHWPYTLTEIATCFFPMPDLFRNTYLNGPNRVQQMNGPNRARGPRGPNKTNGPNRARSPTGPNK